MPRIPGGIRVGADTTQQLDDIAGWLSMKWAGKLNRSEAIRWAIEMAHALAEPETWRAFLEFMRATGEIEPTDALRGLVHHGLSEALRNRAMIEHYVETHTEEV